MVFSRGHPSGSARAERAHIGRDTFLGDITCLVSMIFFAFYLASILLLTGAIIAIRATGTDRESSAVREDH